MVSQGIYTLANDVVYDQLVALLNSIEVNVSSLLPVCIIPYDDRLDKVKSEIKNRPNVSLFDNQESINRWENFAHKVWDAHPRNKESKASRPRWYKGHLHRKFVAFDGDFDRFIFYEADNLAMKPIEAVWQKLEAYDFVFDDWEHRKPTEHAALNIPLIEASGCYREEEIRPKIHDASFFSSKKGLFPPQELGELEDKLINQREVEWINGIGWWDDVFLYNYLTLRSERPIYNFTQSPDAQDRTGNCADADPFVNIDNILYNEQGLKPIHRIHYMNYSSASFARLCQGEDAKINYKDVFLHYRFLKNPEQKPREFIQPSSLTKAGRKLQGIMGKIKRTIS
ncbi:Npun_R2821/Npun_R2822 family protein [Crocosphaera sp.]|uniref:Npun_R2821/Npun_R2822 family protein n=1 Tax=Crocosphaera sp. TaxID=2729996 RepID=UPI003F1E8F3E|nr:methionine synthase [Crocosphaera sp.]